MKLLATLRDEPQEVIGRNCRFLQGRDTDPETVAKIAAALREGREIETDILNYRKDGSAYWNAVSIFPVLVDAKAAFFVSTQMSVATGSQENSTDAALRASQRKLDEVNERLRLTLSISGASRRCRRERGAADGSRRGSSSFSSPPRRSGRRRRDRFRRAVGNARELGGRPGGRVKSTPFSSCWPSAAGMWTEKG